LLVVVRAAGISSTGTSVNRVLTLLIGFLAVSAIYLYAFPQANVLYAGVVALHTIAGVLASVLVLVWLVRSWYQDDRLVQLGMVFLFLGAILGLVLIPAARYLRETRWKQAGRIQNPALPPLTMNGEGDGPNGPFFPSSAQVYGGEKIPSKFFMESDSCKRCHEDIYNQWNSSAHHFSSFNNQWYRKSIEYMQDTSAPSLRNGAADAMIPAVLYAGKWIRRSNRSCTHPKRRPDSDA
jgi:4-amino-4-deoxy-L-arabinose transferase-like glycosyltransferase